MARAVFAFSADHVTLGHVDIVNRSSKLFDEIVIATVNSTGKPGEMFTGKQRLEMCYEVFLNHPCIVDYKFINDTAVNLCKDVRAKFMIRGIRGYTDLDYEYKLAYLNRKISGGAVETIFIPGEPELSMFSSTTVRELIRLNVDTWKTMVPKCVEDCITTWRGNDEKTVLDKR